MRGRNENPITFPNGYVSRYKSRLPHKEEVLSCFPKDEVSDEAVRLYWEVYPPEARDFFHSNPDSQSLMKKMEFWEHYAPLDGSVLKSVYGTSWYLALVYMVRNELDIAISLTLNGALLQECYHSSFDQVSDLYKRESQISEAQTPYISAGIAAVSSHDAMYSFLTYMLPQEYKNRLILWCNMGSQNMRLNFIADVGKSFKSSFAPPAKSDPPHDTISLMIGDDNFQACPSKPLKAVFNEYADKNSVSLKTLRFTYEGKTLFLSTVGKKSPDELGMIDNDSIEVHSTGVHSTGVVAQINVKKKSVTKKPKKACVKSNKRKKDLHMLNFEKSEEEYKEEHSLLLTKLHEEAAPKFKEKRQQLDALSLFKQRPKTKVQTKILDQACSYAEFNPTSEGFGGKAGKTRFLVNVGEVNNLYKSSKSSPRVSSTSSILDLHGCSQTEAISKLNAGLDDWNKKAMNGSYPFVHSVAIICGGGGQVLSGVVEKWIKEKPNVCNAPKMKMPRCKFPSVA